jgi:nicotinamidase/pyrazinamidase
MSTRKRDIVIKESIMTLQKTLIVKAFTASFDVDSQNGFSPLCPNELPVAGATEIVKSLNENATFAKYRIGSKDAHSPEALWVATEDTPQFTPVSGDHKNVDIHWRSHCNVGTFGFEFMSGLPKIEDYDFMVYKGLEKDMHPYGACYHDLNNKMSTGVIEYLKVNNVENVIVGGLATDYCVLNTAKQLKSAGFNVILNLESCRGIEPETIEAAIAEMKELDIVIIESTEQLELV